MKVKTTNRIIILNDKKETIKTDYYEVERAEVDNMLKKVAEGGNEKLLREKLLKM